MKKNERLSLERRISAGRNLIRRMRSSVKELYLLDERLDRLSKDSDYADLDFTVPNKQIQK